MTDSIKALLRIQHDLAAERRSLFLRRHEEAAGRITTAMEFVVKAVGAICAWSLTLSSQAERSEDFVERFVMLVLIGCEESQVVCKAFRNAGHESYSCDLQPTRGNPDWHIQGDIMQVIQTRRWDLIILHPDCTAMALSGNR